METTTKTTETLAVRASINEKAFFASMKHMFASSFSILSEVMQNSRRAGATFVGFDLDEKLKSLTVTDDGCGIEDFGALVTLCESGWDEHTMLKDQPFGMGFFSVLFACDIVCVRSNGKQVTMSKDDIINKRAMHIEEDKRPVLKGTIIELKGLSDDLLTTEYVLRANMHGEYLVLIGMLERFAMGFAIRVLYNGIELERPHAQANLPSKVTQYGTIHIAHIHGDAPETTLFASHSFRAIRPEDPSFYLQGLPIQVKNNKDAHEVIHLDSLMFTPQMPDRNYLFNGTDQLQKVFEELRETKRAFLREQKGQMDGKTFVRKYWNVCSQLGQLHLFNDIEFIPSDSLLNIDHVAYNIDYSSLVGVDMVSRSEIVSGKYKVWTNAPDSCIESENGYSGVILKIMERNKILDLASGFDPNHWIFKIAPSCDDMRLELEPVNVAGQSTIWVDNHDVTLRLVDAVNVRITSDVDPHFLHEEVIDNDWLVHADRDRGNDWDASMICYVTKNDQGNGHPINTLSNFELDDRWDEAWESTATSAWDNQVRTLKGYRLARNLTDALRGAEIDNKRHLGELVLVTSQESWMPDAEPAEYGNARLVAIDLEEEKIWKLLAAKLARKQKPTADALKEMFIAAAGAQGQIGKPVKQTKKTK
jgi:hypothetical protein